MIVVAIFRKSVNLNIKICIERLFPMQTLSISCLFVSIGDSITIASSEELVDACEQYVGDKVLRITTSVTSKCKALAPSVDLGTKVSNSTKKAGQEGLRIIPFVKPNSMTPTICDGTSEKMSPPSSGIKRRRMSHKYPSLPPKRLDKDAKHQPIISSNQRRCVYCSYLTQLAKVNMAVEAPPQIRQPARKCSHCDVHVCKGHWELFHTE
jgi:hypothetical protein